ncbi:MAG TPA: hypothetical protein VI758_10690 [Bacteroidota bacterium]
MISKKDIPVHYFRLTTLVLCGVLGLGAAVAQEEEGHEQKQAKENKLLEQKKDDVFEEMERKNLALRFYNAVNGSEIPGAIVTVNNGEYTTDAEGKILFPTPGGDGVYPVSFRAEKYVPVDFNIEIMAGTIFFNRFSVSPLLDVKFLRVVLDWDASPPDLDAHLVKEGAYHLSFRNMRTAEDGSGQLDHDATNGYGPETITLKEVSPTARYTFFVHNYSDGNTSSTQNLSRSKGTVKVFGDGRLLKIFEIPRNAAGNYWQVFRIANGGIIELNKVADRGE